MDDTMTGLDAVLVIVTVCLAVTVCVTLPKSMELGLAVTPPLELTTVTSAAVSFAKFDSPPPDTVAVLVTLPGALFATATVNVMEG
jgi:hypothetical protein